MKSTGQITDETIDAYLNTVRVAVEFGESTTRKVLEVMISEALIKALGQNLVSEEDNFEARR